MDDEEPLLTIRTEQPPDASSRLRLGFVILSSSARQCIYFFKLVCDGAVLFVFFLFIQTFYHSFVIPYTWAVIF
jgi:hypothetical protein